MALRVENPRIKILRVQDRWAKSERCLGAREIDRLAGMRAGDAILCTRGVLWITQAGDPQDYLLKKGEEFIANRRGLILVQAFANSAYQCNEN